MKILFLFVVLTLTGCASSPKPVVVKSSESPPSASTASISTLPSVTNPAGKYYLDDGPGDNPPENINDIPNATPRSEVLSTRANRPYKVMGKTYIPGNSIEPYSVIGYASWYGRRFHGKQTSSGEIYDMYGMTAAHPTLPIPSYVRVTNLQNKNYVIVRINDRGPFLANRLIDLSYAAANKLDIVHAGSMKVRVESILPDDYDSVTKLATVDTTSLLPEPIKTEIDTAIQNVALEEVKIIVPVIQTTGNTYLQIAAFGSRENAESFLTKFRVNLSELADKCSVVNTNGLFKVRVGPYLQSEATEIAKTIKLKTDLSPLMVRNGG